MQPSLCRRDRLRRVPFFMAFQLVVGLVLFAPRLARHTATCARAESFPVYPRYRPTRTRNDIHSVPDDSPCAAWVMARSADIACPWNGFSARRQVRIAYRSVSLGGPNRSGINACCMYGHMRRPAADARFRRFLAPPWEHEVACPALAGPTGPVAGRHRPRLAVRTGARASSTGEPEKRIQRSVCHQRPEAWSRDHWGVVMCASPVRCLVGGEHVLDRLFIHGGTFNFPI